MGDHVDKIDKIEIVIKYMHHIWTRWIFYDNLGCAIPIHNGRVWDMGYAGISWLVPSLDDPETAEISPRRWSLRQLQSNKYNEHIHGG